MIFFTLFPLVLGWQYRLWVSADTTSRSTVISFCTKVKLHELILV